MSKGLLTYRQKEEELYVKKFKNPNFTNTDNYDNYKLAYQKLYRQAKILHYKAKFTAASDNMKECRVLIIEVMGTQKMNLITWIF